MKQLTSALYTIWMLLGVVGFPASVGWLLHRWQKYGKTKTDAERVAERKRLSRSGTVALAFLLILVSFILYSRFLVVTPG